MMMPVYLSLCLLLTTLGAIVQTVHAGDYDWEVLGRGQVIVESVEDANGIPGVRASFLVKAKRDLIWATLIDYDNFPKFFDGIDSMRVLDSDERGARVEFWVDAVLIDLNYVLYRDYERPGHRLTWKRESGDMKDIHGSWRILDTDIDGSKLLVYESFVDIGFSVATWTIRLAAMKKAESMGHRLRDWIEAGG